MEKSKSSLETEVIELRSLVKTLLEKIEKQDARIRSLETENANLREELRHLKKLKGQPKIRPNKKPAGSDENADGSDENADGHEETPSSGSDSSPPPKGKRQSKPKAGRTSKPVPQAVNFQKCQMEGVQPGWKHKGYKDFTHIDVDLRFTTTIYQREVWLTPEGKKVTAALPNHVKGRFGDNLRAIVLDLYHSCSVTQPLLLDWLHSLDCPISEGSLNNLLTQNHEQFHQEKEEILETGIACSPMLLVDDTGARHAGQNGYCTVIGNDAFTVFSSTRRKSRINFLTLLQGRRSCRVLNPVAIAYMQQVKMAKKWIDTLSSFGEIHFLSETAWEAFLDDLKMCAEQQRRWATEAVLKAGLLSNGFPESMIIHSDGARQFDTVFAHSLCWFHAGRPLAKLIPANEAERAERDAVEDQYWQLYDAIEAYSQKPTSAQKEQIEQDFDRWVTTGVDYLALRAVLGQLHRAREELLLILKYPWLPLHNNFSERQIREYVKRRKISGGTRSQLGRLCRDTFASLKKTCKLHGISFARYLRDRLSGAGKIPRLPDLVRGVSEQFMACAAP